MGVKDRQGMDQNVLTGDLPQVDQRLCVGQQVVMRHHRAFGSPGRARCVQQSGQVVRIPRNGVECGWHAVQPVCQCARPVCVQCQDLRPDIRSQRGHVRSLGRRTHDQTRRGVFDEIAHFVPGIGRVQGQEHAACLNGRGVQHHHFSAFRGLDHDAVPGRQSGTHQHMRHLCRRLDKRGV